MPETKLGKIGRLLTRILPPPDRYLAQVSEDFEKTLLTAIAAGVPEDEAVALVRRISTVTTWSMAEIRYRLQIQGAERLMQRFPAPAPRTEGNTEQ